MMKFFRRIWRKKKTTTVRVAKQEGFINDEQAEEAERLLECNPADTSTDLLVNAHLLTPSQANVVALKVAEAAPTEAAANHLKQARQQMDETRTTAVNLADVIAARAAKKTSSG